MTINLRKFHASCYNTFDALKDRCDISFVQKHLQEHLEINLIDYLNDIGL